MTTKRKSLPTRYHTVTPYLIVTGADRLIEFIKQVFEAQETERLARPDGTVGHAEVTIGDSIIMLGEAGDQAPPMPAGLHVYVDDCDGAYQRALAAGATSIMEPADQFYGDRNAGVKDPFGNTWWIVTHFEDLSPEELQRRAASMMQ